MHTATTYRPLMKAEPPGAPPCVVGVVIAVVIIAVVVVAVASYEVIDGLVPIV